VFGASGDLAKKKTFPALLGLFRQHHLPTQFQIIGYARSKLELSEFRQRVTEKAKLKDEQMLHDFQSKLFYISGDYDNTDSFRHLNEALVRGEKEMLAQLQGANSPTTNIDGSAVQIRRIYYLALPPAMFHPVCTQIRNVLHDPLVRFLQICN
jgi:glucose-6-phosphate 1-dehydrogenase